MYFKCVIFELEPNYFYVIVLYKDFIIERECNKLFESGVYFLKWKIINETFNNGYLEMTK